MQVSGPITSALYEIGGRKVLLCGDMHFSRTGDCKKTNKSMSIAEWLHVALSNSAPNHVVDLYLETRERTPDFVQGFLQGMGVGPESPGYIHDVIEYFASLQCLSRIKTRCHELYPWARVHYVDPRTLPMSDLNNFIHLMQPLMNSSNGYLLETRLSDIQKRPEFKKAMQWLRARPTAKAVTQAIEDNFDRLKISRQLKNVVDAKERGKLKAWFKSCVSDLIKSPTGVAYDHYAASMVSAAAARPFDSRAYVEFVTSSPYLFSFVLEATLLEMDMYALGRMLRTFKDAPRPERVIVYAGDHHVQNYESCLKFMGGKCLERGKQGTLRCTEFGPKTEKTFFLQ